MKIYMFSIRDVKAGMYKDIYSFPATEVFLRELGDFLTHPDQADSMLVKYADDFGLYILGQWDTESGDVVPSKSGPEYLMTISQLIRQTPKFTDLE